MQTEDLKENSKQTTAEETPQQETQTNAADAAGVDETAAKKSEGAAEEKTPEQDEKDAKIEELQNRVLRLQADFDNFRRRNTSEREQLATFVTADVVGKFLKVLDNFERAEAAAQKSDDAAGIYSGIEMIRRQFEQTFKDLGVEEIKAQGEKFDPELHEAVMRGQNPDMDEDTVEMVLEKGYKLRDKVIRHSKVKVISNE
ncbi:MAG: nucleotide exchange factor GrpE [Acidaminococcaceae bacterium]|uniref:nucleotide exchange factor GrpE n=1 Tax=uncultured Phascolarctobacterium sp. TaxID=512296 RepID=UPI0025CFD7A9|nr:nucleotide exchange factor GrpE [uncultured Phascolarctobacterium sp.]MDO5379321.1 nucleotide exchange factor GrpE [Acidaminococcaceae bacterium]